MTDTKRIVALLGHDDAEKRTAAAIVLGELKAKEALDDLRALAKCGRPLEEKAALDALAKIGGVKALPELFRALSSNDARVRDAGVRALVAQGEAVVPKIRERMAGVQASPEGALEKRGLDAALAELGGRDAFEALLDGLASSDAETAKAAALTVRREVKDADAKQRRSYASTTMKFLKKKGASAETQSSALKILGYLEDQSALPVLVDFAVNGALSAVKQEAIIAMRFVLGADRAPEDVAKALLRAAQGTDRLLARTAIDTLAGLALDDDAVPVFARLALHEEPERSRFAIEKLARQGGSAAAKALVSVIVDGDRGRGQAAKDALAPIAEATPHLAVALTTTKDADRAKMLADALKPRTAHVTKAQVQKLIAELVERLTSQTPGVEALLQIARVVDPEGTADALRELAAKLKKSKKDDRATAVLFLLTNSDAATDDDRARLAVGELLKSRLDATPHARSRDEALKQLAALAAKGGDVVAVLKKDKRVTPEMLFYVGFHFVEEDDPIGEELLKVVVDRAGRTKIGKAAKNKLSLVGA